MRCEIYKDKAGEWRWRLVAANGKKVADSGEGYTTLVKCGAALRKLLRTVSAKTNVRVLDAS